MTDSRYIEAHKQTMDDILLAIPFVEAGQAFGYPAYKTNGKTFCFVGGNGISIKLPKKRVAELIPTHVAFHSFYPTDGILWTGWMSIQYVDSEDYRQHLDLYEESVAYVTA